MQRSLVILATILMLTGWRAAWSVDDDDVYGEDGWEKFKPGPKWQEQEVGLPPYPSGDDLIEVDIALKDFPFTLLIDARSLQVGEDRVVRYAVVLRSAAGTENVFYEGMRCSKKKYQRYAFGSGGEFQPVESPEWRSVRSTGHGRYRAALMEGFLCPLPGRNREQRIIERLKAPNRRYEQEF